MDTVPLLTPTMETELLKEPWVFPQQKFDSIKEEERITATTTATASSIWEENFQDLSSWCMDTFQGQCDFHTGESPTFKLSGTKYEGNSVLSSEEGVLKDLMSVAADEDKWSMKMNTAGSIEHMNNNCHVLQSPPDVTSDNKYKKEDSIAEASNAIDSWTSKLTKESTANLNTSGSWSKQINPDASTPFQIARYPIECVDLNDASASIETTDDQRETWDVLRTVETTGSDTFDLLSYLCDDEVRSPEGSVSTDSSSVVSKPWSVQTVLSVKVKTENEQPTNVRRSTKTTRASAATVTSASTETATATSRRTERTRSTVQNRVEKTYNRSRREKAGRKRYVETDSDERSLPANYRESREKNNEASRKSRMNKKAKETEMAMKAIELERDNRILKMKVEELEKLVTSMRSALLRSALKKES